MANKLIQNLTATAAVLTTDLFEKQPIAGPPSEKATVAQLVTLLNTIYAPISGGAYVLKAGDTMTGLLQFSGTGHFGLQLNSLTTAQRDAIGVGSAGVAIWNTTTARFEHNIGGSWKSFVRLDGDTMTGLLTIAQATANTGAIASTGYSLTGANAQSLLSLAGTWNTSGAPVGIRLAIVDTASQAGNSKLIELLGGAAGTTSLFSVNKAGQTTTASGFVMNGGDMILGGGSDLSWSGRGKFSMISDGVLRIVDSAGTSFSRLQFGGTTSAFPAIKRSTTILQARLADDSAYAPIEANTVRTATAYTVATLPAAGTQGRRSYVTDALAPAFLAVIVGGGAVIAPVFDNGTNWVAE